jgi:ArsR family transcriptional regulator
MNISSVAPSVRAGCDALGALSDPLRWQIVSLLTDGERCVCDLETALELQQSRLSYHLAVLRNAGVITARKQGRWVYYSVCPDALEELASVLGELAAESREARNGQGSVCCD